jgi:VanZ family protein
MWRHLLLLCALLVVYGSLYPFHFVAPRSLAAAWDDFILDWHLWTSTGDVVGNIVLFVPFGALWTAAFPRSTATLARLLAATAACTLFALVVQVAQIWFPPRDAAIADAFWNLAGSLLGIVAGRLLLRAGVAQHGAVRSASARVAAGLVLLWLVCQWAPFIPTIDWQGLKDSLKPLLLAPEIRPLHMLHVAARVLAIGCLVAALVATPRRRPWTLAALLAVALLGKLFFVGQSLDATTVTGFGAGLVAWCVLAAWPRAALRWSLSLLLVGYSVDAMLPFVLRDAPQPFHWLPFTAMLEGSMAINTASLLEGLFTAGAVLWLVHSLGGGVRTSSIALALWVLLLEYGQRWIEGRTADITPALLVLVAGYVIERLTQPAPTRRLRTA